MYRFIENNWLKACFVMLSIIILAGVDFAQVNCNCVPDEVLIDLNPLNQNDLPAIAAQYGLQPAPLEQVGTPPTYRMRIVNGQTPFQVISAMNGDARIFQKEVNRRVHLVERDGLSWTQGRSWAIGRSWAVAGSAKGYGRQWFPQTVRLEQAYAAAGTRGKTVESQPRSIVVAVLDTGIDLTHPAFAGKLVEPDKYRDFVGNDNDPSEEGILHTDPVYGHGTHVAGIVALTAPDVKIMPLRVLDANGEGQLWQVTAAILWAARNGADIINMSFGYPENFTTQSNTLLQDLMDGCDGVYIPGQQRFCLDEKTLSFIASAGNGGQINNGADPIFPAAEAAESVDNILAVGSSSRYDKLSIFSTMNFGGGSGGDRWVKGVAPGEEIISAIPGGRYGMWSGTSMAAPIAAGIAALVKAKNPGYLPGQVISQVEDTGYGWECTRRVGTHNVFIKTSRIDAFCAVTGLEDCGVPKNTNACQ